MAKKIINVVYDVNDKDLDVAKKKIQDVEKETKKSETSFQKAGAAGVKAFGLIGAAAAALGLAAIGQKIFSITAEFQKLSAVLTNTLGSRSEAQKALNMIKEFAAKTPFSVITLTDNFVKLANRGIKPTVAQLTAIGDLASSLGKPFEQVVEAILDVNNPERWKEIGIKAETAGDKVKLSFKGVTQEVDRTIEGVTNAIVAIGEMQGVSGAMAVISETLGGKLSNLGDNFDALFNTLGSKSSGLIGGFLDLANNAIGAVNDALTDNIGNLRDEQAELNVLVGAITDANVPLEVRSSLIAELNKKYPDFLKNLNAEKVTNEQLALRLSDVNDQFFRKIALQQAEDRFKDSQEEILDLIDEEVELRKTLQEVKTTKSFTDTEESGLRAGMDADTKRRMEVIRYEDLIKKSQEDRAEIQQELTDKLKEYNKALDLFKTTANDYFDPETKVTATAEDANAAAAAALKKAHDERFAASDKVFADLAKQRQDAADEQVKIDRDAEERSLENQDYFADLKAKKLKEQKDYEYEILEKAADERLQLEQRITELSIEFAAAALEFALTSREEDIGSQMSFYDQQTLLAGDNERRKDEISLQREKFEEQSRRRQIEADKKNAVRKILIDTAVAVSKTFAEFGYPAGIIPAALMTGISLISIANVRKYKDGKVLIDGPGTTTSDSIPAMLSKKESVINAEASMASPNLLNAINDRKIDDRILQVAANGGSQVNVFDDSRIIAELQKGRVDYDVHGYTLMKSANKGKNFKLLMRSKNQGY